MKAKTLIFTAVILILSILSSVPAGAETEQVTGILRTTRNPDAYAEITLKGDLIEVRGKYTGDPPTEIRVGGSVVSSYAIDAKSDGSFTASLRCTGEGYKYRYLFITRASGVTVNYMLGYNDGGWYVPDNGLDAANAIKLEDIQTAPAIAAAYYLSAAADPDEIRETLGELEKIVEEVCGGEKDDYKKAFLLNKWIGENIYYDHDAAETSVTMETIAVHNVLKTRRTTCAGFADTYSALLETAGIRSINLKGASIGGGVSYDTLTEAGENHEFSAFWYEKQKRWVYVDACWTSGNDYKGGTYEKSETPATDKYFDITGEALALIHRVDKAEERIYSEALNAALERAGEETEEASAAETTTAETTAAETTTAETTAEETTEQTTEETTEQTTEETAAAAEETTAETVPAETEAPPISKPNDKQMPLIITAAAVFGILVIAIGIIAARRNKK